MTRAIEDLGYDSVWLGEHLLYRFADRPARGPWEAWTLLAGLAAATSRIELGPLVACTNFHNPALLAKQAATIDEISGGRFILGLGAGWNDTEFKAFGFPFDHRIDRFEESFTIIRTLLREGAIDFDGRFYQARDCELIPRGPRPDGPPLMIGSRGDADARDHDAVRGLVERVVRGHGEQPGRGAGPADPRRRRLRARRSRSRRGGADGGRPGPHARRHGSDPGQRRKAHGAAARGIARHTWPTNSVPTLARGSATSSWSWTRSPATASRHSHPSSRSWIGAESCVTGTFVREDRRDKRASLTAAMRTSNQFAARGPRLRSRPLAAGLIAMGLFVAACGSPPPSVEPATPKPTPVVTPNPQMTDPASADAVFKAIARAKLGDRRPTTPQRGRTRSSRSTRRTTAGRCRSASTSRPRPWRSGSRGTSSQPPHGGEAGGLDQGPQHPDRVGDLVGRQAAGPGCRPGRGDERVPRGDRPLHRTADRPHARRTLDVPTASPSPTPQASPSASPRSPASSPSRRPSPSPRRSRSRDRGPTPRPAARRARPRPVAPTTSPNSTSGSSSTSRPTAGAHTPRSRRTSACPRPPSGPARTASSSAASCRSSASPIR